MSSTVSASSNRKLFRAALLAALLFAAVAGAITFSARPFRYDSWPEPPPKARVEPLVHVRPDAPIDAPAVAAPGDRQVRPVKRVKPQSGLRRRSRGGRRPGAQGRPPASTAPSVPAAGPPDAPAPPTNVSDGSADGDGQPSDPAPAEDSPPSVEVAQADPGALLPPAASAKPETK
jgi:hypothetical protein